MTNVFLTSIVFCITRINHYMLWQIKDFTFLVPTDSSVSVWCPQHREVRGLLKDAPLGTRKVKWPPLTLGSYFWGLSSGSFKWGLVTAGTSWTKLLLPAPLLCCSHSPLIGFDCICLNPQWKKEKGGWRGLQWNWSVSVYPDTVALKKKGLPLPRLIKQRLGGDKAWWVTEQT